MSCRYTDTELEFWKKIYSLSISAGSPSDVALYKATQAVHHLRNQEIENPKSPEEIREEKLKSSGLNKESNLDIIKKYIE